jgi:hypothetical protein
VRRGPRSAIAAPTSDPAGPVRRPPNAPPYCAVCGGHAPARRLRSTFVVADPGVAVNGCHTDTSDVKLVACRPAFRQAGHQHAPPLFRLHMDTLTPMRAGGVIVTPLL